LKKWYSAVLFLVIMMNLFPVWANRAGLKVTAPEEVGAGESFTVELEISHSNNDEGHYVDWVRIWMDDELVKEWTYTPDDFVQETRWTLEYETSIDEPAEIRARANCNLHGGSQKRLTVAIPGMDDEGEFSLLYPLIAFVVVLVIVSGVLISRR